MPSCWLSKLFWFPVLFIFQIFCFDFSSLFGEAFTLEILLLRKAQHLKPRSLYKILCDVAAGQVPNRIHLTAEEIASECGSDGIAFARNCIDLLIPKKSNESWNVDQPIEIWGYWYSLNLLTNTFRTSIFIIGIQVV